MADEIQIALQESGLTVYAAIRNIAGNVWDTTANMGSGGFVSITAINWTNADIPLSEEGSSGDYFGDVPAGLGDNQIYVFEIFEQIGSSPVRKDDWLISTAPMYWDGTRLYYQGEFALVEEVLRKLGLDHLLVAAVSGSDIGNNSIIAKLASSAATADWDTFDNTTDSLEALANA